MLHHRIESYFGQRPVQGNTVHAYKAKCGAQILAATVFKQGQIVAVGAAPHAQCAACFRGPQGGKQTVRVIDGDLPVESPDGSAGMFGPPPGDMMDVDGRPKPAVVVDAMGVPVEDPYDGKALNVRKTNREGDRVLRTEEVDPMGSVEANDWG